MARLYPTSGSELQSKDNRFDEADASHDGVLTREEAGKMPMLSKHFDEVDTNKDGKVMREEMDATMERRRHGRDAKKHSHGDGVRPTLRFKALCEMVRPA